MVQKMYLKLKINTSFREYFFSTGEIYVTFQQHKTSQLQITTLQVHKRIKRDQGTAQ